MVNEGSDEVIIDYEKMGHKIQVYKVDRGVEVVRKGSILFQSRRALLMYENGHDPVYYIPKADVPEQFLEATETKTKCPFKGTANYYNLKVDGETLSDSVWQYLESKDEFRAIREYVAFYPSSIDGINIV